MPGHRPDIENPLVKPALVFYSQIDAAFRDASVPLLRGHLQEGNMQNHWIYWISRGKWSIAPEAAGTVLSRERARALESASTKPFRFQDLPAELRVAIYELVLLLPKSGVSLQVDPLAMRAFSRNYQMPIEAAGVFPVPGRQRRRPETPRLLNVPRHALTILAVNKSLYKEAAPIFYGDNLVVFDHPAQLHDVLRRLSSDRAAMIKKIAIQYSVHDRVIGGNAFRALRDKLTELRELKLWMHETEWATATVSYRGTERRRYSDMLDLPGLAELCSVRGLDNVSVYGTCPTIKPIIEAELVLPRTTLPGGQEKHGKKGSKKIGGVQA